MEEMIKNIADIAGAETNKKIPILNDKDIYFVCFKLDKFLEFINMIK